MRLWKDTYQITSHSSIPGHELIVFYSYNMVLKTSYILASNFVPFMFILIAARIYILVAIWHIYILYTQICISTLQFLMYSVESKYKPGVNYYVLYFKSSGSLSIFKKWKEVSNWFMVFLYVNNCLSYKIAISWNSFCRTGRLVHICVLHFVDERLWYVCTVGMF